MAGIAKFIFFSASGFVFPDTGINVRNSKRIYILLAFEVGSHKRKKNASYVCLRTETIVRLRENDTQAFAFFSLL